MPLNTCAEENSAIGVHSAVSRNLFINLIVSCTLFSVLLFVVQNYNKNHKSGLLLRLENG